MNDAEKTKIYLQEHGWNKDILVNAEHEVCLWGAITMIRRASSALPETLKDIIAEQFPERSHIDNDCPVSHFIMEFNDHADTTYTDVNTILDKASMRLEEMV